MVIDGRGIEWATSSPDLTIQAEGLQGDKLVLISGPPAAVVP
jgi:hypothetical protein